MNICILDGYTLNPGDLEWTELEKLGDISNYDRTAAQDVVARAKDAEVILTNKVPLTSEMLDQLPNLKYIGVMATGYNIVDVKAANLKGIVVTNVPGYSTYSVVQLTFALLLELTHHVQRHSDAVQEGRWANCPDFSFHDYPLVELSGKTIGIIGYGTIGQQVGVVARGRGMKVLASRRHIPKDKEEGIEYAAIADVLSKSDVISLHCPLTEETKGLINAESIASMKSSSFLINTARGPLIDEAALAKALNEEKIAGAGLDVLSSEPPAADNPLLSAKRCIITPHIAWASFEARKRLMDELAKNLDAFLQGRERNKIVIG